MPSYSSDDQNFLALTNSKIQRDISGNWMVPSPFHSDRKKVPDNRSQAFKRAIILDQNHKKNPTKREHALEFMENIIKRGHAEIAPPQCQEEELWYLPIFGVYNAKKTGTIRMVFDSISPIADHLSPRRHLAVRVSICHTLYSNKRLVGSSPNFINGTRR